MFSRDQIPPNGRIADDITVTVRDISQSSNEKVDFEVVVEDVDGYAIPLKIWSTHDIALSLVEGHKFEFDGVRGRYWTQNGTRHYQLSSTTALTTTDLGPAEMDCTRFLVVGDTHVGYRHRTQTDKSNAATQLDARETFQSVIQHADALNVDAVIHAGDVFDHGAIGSDRSFVTDLLTEQYDHLPFYYIYGNHDAPASRRTLDGATTDQDHIHRLPTEGTTVGDSTLFGIDYNHSTFSEESIGEEFSVRSFFADANILVAHQTPYPVQEQQGKRLHDQQAADFRDVVAQSSVDIDLIVSGHMHVGQEAKLEGHGTPVIITGAPSQINKGSSDHSPSVWVVRIEDDSLDITRQPV